MTAAAAMGFGVAVGATEIAGAADAAAATAAGEVPAAGGALGFGAVAGEALGETCAVDCECAGARRCTLRINFMTPKPITRTTIPKISGIGDTRSLPPPPSRGRRGAAGRLLGTTGALTG